MYQYSVVSSSQTNYGYSSEHSHTGSSRSSAWLPGRVCFCLILHNERRPRPPTTTQLERAFVIPILSTQSPAAVQSGSLWRNRCLGDTLAGNYRVGDYNVGYSAQESHPAEQSHQQHGYDASSQHHHHHRGSIHHTGGPAHGVPEQPGAHQAHHHAMSQHHHHPHPHPHHHQQQQQQQVILDPSQMGHSRHLAAASHFAGPGAVVAPLYPSMTAPSPTHAHHSGIKRPHPDELELSIPPMPDLEQGELESMQQTSLGAAYAEAAAQSAVHPPTHHHHRLPDTGPPSKLTRREGEGGVGGAPSVVGQPGMPPAAPRPRGPKLKFTPEDDQLLIDLKENKNLTWKQIADFFPGRSSGTLQVRYCTKLKAKTTQWTDETDEKLRAAMQEYENEKWRIVANKLGAGFTPAACRERAHELYGPPL
ncbi:hypothetical protein SODALDRAFT_339863 [Sodiomyces alkalinus F11]|uniref:Myb-like domain-containing protein n=1 Tax=Sodiomyces alkalinus (strain CBS 110278 / VKM F-3762 / F11) TaxID=1314773 RepID=A0A3N2PVE5_SODAK|nr:hypothetical protein SODALDRAFT_339863 [Sodiomyces alkalinus F11]ROT38460.1 hypothetical protein SODALDRAFT_339863 [Sodiomyces alkalinus F11]